MNFYFSSRLPLFPAIKKLPGFLTHYHHQQPLESVGTGAWNINWPEFTNTTGTTVMMTKNQNNISDAPSAANQLSPYPNPFKDRINISLDNVEKGRVEITLVSMDGVVQKTSVVHKTSGRLRTEVFAGDLPKGQYLLTIRMKGWVQSSKLVKL